MRLALLLHQVAGDKVKETGRTVQDAAAQGLGSAQEALDTKNKPSDGTGAAGELRAMILQSS